jgi:hypothetical protein
LTIFLIKPPLVAGSGREELAASPACCHPKKLTPGRRVEMAQHRGLLSLEERVRIMELQDALLDRLFEQADALADGNEIRVDELQGDIDDLVREREEIEKWAAVGSA